MSVQFIAADSWVRMLEEQLHTCLVMADGKKAGGHSQRRDMVI